MDVSPLAKPSSTGQTTDMVKSYGDSHDNVNAVSISSLAGWVLSLQNLDKSSRNYGGFCSDPTRASVTLLVGVYVCLCVSCRVCVVC